MEFVSADVFADAKPGDITVSQPGESAAQVETKEVVAEAPAEQTVTEAAPPAQETQVQAEPTEQVSDVKEVINSVPAQKDWKEVLKDSGFDDWSIRLLEHKQAKGTAKEFLEAMAVDYKQMPAEEILKRKLQDENPGISQRVLDFKLREELKKYPLDADIYDEDQVAIGKEMLEMDANRVRQAFIEKQNQYLEPLSTNPAEAQQQEYQRQVEAYRQNVIQNQFTQSLIQNKRLVLDGGKEKFNFEVGNPQELIDMVISSDKWQQEITNPDGSPKIDLLLEAAAYVKYKAQIHQQLINYGKTLGEKKVIEEDLINIPQPAAPVPGGVQKDLWQTIRDSWK